MSISTSTNKAQYAISGSTYAIPFPYFAKSDIYAVLTTPTGDVPLALTTNFTLTDPGASGTLTKVGVWDATATQITIYREVPLTQETDLANGDTLDAEVLEGMFDRLTALAQQNAEAITRQVSIPITDAAASLELPNKTERANKFLGFDTNGDAVADANGPAVMTAAELLTEIKTVDGAGSGLDTDLVRGENLFSGLNQNIAFAAGKGIDFSATTDGSGTMSSELLNDYEEGTFTPVMETTGTIGTPTYSWRDGRYTKIGNKVFVEFGFNISSWAGSPTGNLKITGLPFVAKASTYYNPQLATYASNLALTASNQIMTTAIVQATATAFPYQGVVGGGLAAQIPVDTAMILVCSGFYEV
jgi:hypothetical protein